MSVSFKSVRIYDSAPLNTWLQNLASIALIYFSLHRDLLYLASHWFTQGMHFFAQWLQLIVQYVHGFDQALPKAAQVIT